MPAATAYKPDDKDQRKAAEQELRDRRKLHDTHLAYYRGQHPKSLKVKPGTYDPNVAINEIRTAVRTIVAFTAPEFPELDIDIGVLIPGEESNETRQEISLDDTLTQVWTANGGIDLLMTALIMGALDGQVFWRIWVDKQERIRITLVNGGSTITWWDAHNRHRPLWYEQHWQADGLLYRHDIIPDFAHPDRRTADLNPFEEEQEPQQWIVRQFVSEKGQQSGITGETKWKLDEEFMTGTPLSPIVDNPHLPDPWQYYGEDEVGQLISLNNALNAKATDYNQILRFHASPRTVGFGFEANTIQDTSIDSLWVIPDKDARVETLEMETDQAAMMNYINTLRDSMMRVSQTVILPSDPRILGNITNLGIRMLFGPMIAKSNQLHRTYGKAIAEVSARVLSLAGEMAIEPEVIWPNALPSNRLEEVQTLAAEMVQGLTSAETAQRELGRDPLEERRRMRNQRLIQRQEFGGATVNGQLVA